MLTFLVEKTDNEAFQCVFFFFDKTRKRLYVKSIVFVVVLPLQSKGV